MIDVFGENVYINTLDLSFNFIRHLESRVPVKILNLDINLNGIKVIREDFFKGKFFTNLNISLNLGSNRLSFLDKFIFKNGSKLKELFLNENRFFEIKSVGLENIKQLESIDLSNNLIEYINKNDFNFFKKLKSIDTSNNLIKYLDKLSFLNLNNLESLKISNNSLQVFDMRVLNSSTNMFELDLSFTNLIIFEYLTNVDNIQIIKLEKVKFNPRKFSEIFLNENLIELDYSQNCLDEFLSKFSILTNIEILILKKVNLKSMEQIQFQNFLKLKKLDLSFNNLTRLNYDSFKSLKKFKYLDLSFNIN
jgi:Leucine-rich repeat (LRR) protein